MPPFGGDPLWWLTPPPSPRFAVGLWVLSSVPHDSAGKRRVAYSVPRMGEVRRSRIRGSGQRPLIIAMLSLLMNPKASSRNQPVAGSRKPIVFLFTSSGSFPPTGFYYRLSQMLHVLRAFCIECASRPKFALSLPIRGLSF